MADLPADLTYGKVVGRFLTAVGDSADAGSNPDSVVPAGLAVKFTPKAALIRSTSPSALIVPKAVTCTVDESGDLLDPQGAAGVWLVTGVYTVSYQASDFAIASHDVEVLAAHTAGAPLDLALAAPPPVPVTPTQYAELDARLQVVESSGGGGGGGGVTDHGALTGLGDDDHVQYHTDARGDARYYTKTANDALLAGKQPTGDYATNTALTTGLAGKAAASHGHVIADTAGLQAALDGKQAAGSYAPASHAHTASEVSDSTTTGRALLTATDAAAARTAIGAGTSSLAIGTTGTTAAAGNRAATETATGMVELATTTEATTGTDTVRAVTPAGVKAVADTKANVSHTHTASQVSDSTTVGRAVLTAADAAAARTAIGAGTGTSSFSGAYADLTGKPTLGTAAAAASTDFATAAQGAKADTALQPATGQTINAQTGTSYTLVASDAGKVVTLSNAAAITLNAPGSVFTAGQRVDVVVIGAGMATVVGTSGATANGTPSLVSRAQWSAFTILWTSATACVVIGDMA